jgi:hypothetical protein
MPVSNRSLTIGMAQAQRRGGPDIMALSHHYWKCATYPQRRSRCRLQPVLGSRQRNGWHDRVIPTVIWVGKRELSNSVLTSDLPSPSSDNQTDNLEDHPRAHAYIT